MKKTLFFVILVFLFSCKHKVQENIEVDVSLKKIIINRGDGVEKIISPVSLICNYELEEQINKVNYLLVEAVPSDENAEIYFGQSYENKRTEKYEKYRESIVITVKKNKKEKKYTLNIKKLDDKTGIQSLVIKQKDVVLKNLNSFIPKVINVDLRDRVSSEEFVLVNVTPKEALAEVLFDEIPSISNGTKKYESYQKLVKVTIKKGNEKSEYKLNFREPIIPEPKDYLIKCNVVDSVGGTNVEGAKVKVYEEGSIQVLQEKTTNIEGNVYFSLEGDKYYTFVSSKKGSAGSRVESVYLASNKRLFLPIVMREGEVGALAKPPEVIGLSITHNGNEKPLEKNEKIDFSKINESTVLNIKIRSTKIIPERKIDNRRFGVMLNIGSCSSGNSYGAMYLIPNLKETKIDQDGLIIQNFSTHLNKLVASDGENTLHFMIYDVAGNRCERHQRVIFENASLNNNEINSVDDFSEFSVYSERYYRSLETFGMPKEEGMQTSARVVLFFKFNNDIEIGKVNVFRRPYQEGSTKENWELVHIKHYEKNFTGQYFRDFKISDDSGTLKEGEIYQYKLEAYNSKGRIVSPIATVRIMEAFNVFLTNPKNGSEISFSDIPNKNFSFKISNKKLWESSDYFSFAVLINNENSEPIYVSKMRYYLNGEKNLQIADKSKKYKKYTDYNPSTTNIDELIQYTDGIVTITNNFFNEAGFNIEAESLAKKITQGGLYYWDIQDIDVYQDDVGAFFVKEYPYLDNKTGEPFGSTKSHSYSCSNLDGVGGAVNGKALFIVK